MKPKPDLEKMRAQLEASGADLSLYPILNSRPDIFSDYVWVWEAFLTLSSSRQMGMSSPQPISLSEIKTYIDLYKIDDRDEVDELIYLVQHLDHVFVAASIAKAKAPAKK